MRTSLIASLLCAAGLVFAYGCAPPSDKKQKQFLEYKAQAEKGDHKAQNSLGLCYSTGYGVKQDHTEAAKWYRKAAEQNDATGQYNLGMFYLEGKGVVKDYAEAVKWFRKSAEQNDSLAQYSLSACYHNGKGVEKNYAEAVKWLRKAAEQNNAKSQYSLGLCYYYGEGVEKDDAEAYAWLDLATKTVEKSAKTRDFQANALSPQQVADAQKRTKELRAQIEAKHKSGGK